MSFLTDMNKFEHNLTKEVKRVHGAIGVKYLGGIIGATPIDLEYEDVFHRPRTPGRLKRSWFTGIGMNLAFDGEQVNPFDQMAQVVFGSMPDVTITMSNGAPYAELIEYGNHEAPNTRPPPTWYSVVPFYIMATGKWEFRGKTNGYPGGIDFQRSDGWVRLESDKWDQAKVDAVVRENDISV